MRFRWSWALRARWMDAVELPLPAKVEFGKILAQAAAVEGVDGGIPGGGGGEVLRRCADTDRRHGSDIAPLFPLLIVCLVGWVRVLAVMVEGLGVICLFFWRGS